MTGKLFTSGLMYNPVIKFIVLHFLIFSLLFIILVLVLVIYRQRKRLKKEEFIIESIREASEKLPEMGHRIEFIKMICKIIKNITNSDEFVYFTYNEKSKLLIPLYAESPYAEQVLKVRLGLGEGFTGRVARMRKPGILNFANEKKGSKHVEGTPKEENSLLAVPMLFNNSLLGVILQVKYGNKIFDEEDLTLSEIFVNIISGFLYTKNLIYGMRNSIVQLIISFVKNVEYKDAYTAGHSIRVGHFAEIIARKMGLSERDILITKIGGFLHDLGKIAVADRILKEEKNLKEEDWENIKSHPKVGAELISKFEFLQDVVPCIWFHHKHYDGTGYPCYPIKGEEIPICGRIIAVADAIDAITTTRPGHPARSLRWAFRELGNKSGTQFDPKVVEAAIASKEEIAMYVRKEFDVEDEENYRDFEKIF